MQDLFLKTLRWYIVVAFTIAGIGALNYADRADIIKPVLPGIVCLGAAFVLGTAWKELRRKILFITIVFTVALAYFAQYVPDMAYIALGRHMAINYFVGWAGLVFVAGFPVMMVVFDKFSD